MNVLAHHVAQRIVNQAVAGDGVFTVKGCRHNAQPVMASTGTGAGMARMQVAVVNDFDLMRGKYAKALVDLVDNGHGRTFLNGLTVQRTKTPR